MRPLVVDDGFRADGCVDARFFAHSLPTTDLLPPSGVDKTMDFFCFVLFCWCFFLFGPEFLTAPNAAHCKEPHRVHPTATLDVVYIGSEIDVYAIRIRLPL